MDTRCFHLIIYMRTTENVINALPLALIAVSSFDAIGTTCILSEITKTMLTNLLEYRTVRAIIEVTGYQKIRLR